MSYTSRVKYSASAGQTDFDLTFPYLDKAHVHVFVAGTEVPFTWVTSSRIALLGGATLHELIEIRRTTPVSTALASFANGQTLTGPDLNLVITQALYREQELADDISDIGEGGGSVAGVTSINGQAGVVTLTAASLGAALEAHSHGISDIGSLQSSLDAKAPLASPALTGTPTAPTAAPGTNTTQLASTAFVAAAIASVGAGVALATTGTPADLGSANRGAASTAARSDHVHKLPTPAEVGAADTTLSNVTTTNLRTALLASGAILLASGVTETALPASARANKVLSFDASGHPTFTDPAAGGGSGVSQVNGLTGAVTVTPALIGAVPETEFKTLRAYGTLVDNGVTDNKTTFDAYLADSGQKAVWVGDDGDKTLSTTNSLNSLVNKRFRGKTKIKLSGDNLPGDFIFLTSRPTQGVPGGSILTDMSGDHTFADISYKILGNYNDAERLRTRLDEPAYNSVYTPQWRRFSTRTGYSGFGAQVVTGCSAGQFSITLDTSGAGTISSFPTGAPVAVWAGQNNDGGKIWHQSTVDSWDSTTGVLTFVDAAPTGGIPAGLATVGGATFKVVASIGKRTHQMETMVELEHGGAGDAYGFFFRGYAGYPGRKGQRHTYYRQTLGAMGGSITAQGEGSYLQSQEWILEDDGSGKPNDAIGIVMSFRRTHKSEQYGNRWSGITINTPAAGETYPGSGNAFQPLNNVFVFSGQADVGLDFGALADFGANQRAIALKEGMKIEFDAGITSPSPDDWPRGYSNVVSPTFMRGLSNLDGRGKRLDIVVNNSLSAAGYGVANFRGSRVEFHRSLTMYNNSGTQAFDFDITSNSISLGSDSSVGITRIGSDLILKSGSATRLTVGSGGTLTGGGALTMGGQVQGAGVVSTGNISSGGSISSGTSFSAATSVTAGTFVNAGQDIRVNGTRVVNTRYGGGLAALGTADSSNYLVLLEDMRQIFLHHGLSD